ncbi:hypothetical protein CLV28_1107 [Sediminihabitans luteus]|uniref:DUF3137 domain-containing protein n=1 Tax=Sediminihabitans luteus TaxID=1138585 RepID=A0A2M9D101_9CELL|nr:hypothetical protein [Sediminihabitans luteus]PJJ77881.1 hypothetical protein CLV28_1107 [Sediminihabitans luteus]GII99761.1 hypothetical protein Slu03_21390 [Sediminihabitans luteus]
MPTLDVTALTTTPSAAQVDALRDSALRGELGAASARTARADASGAAVAATLVAGFVALLPLAFLALTRNTSHLAVIVAIVAVAVALWFGVRALVGASARRRWRDHARVVAFARANGFDAEPVVDLSSVPSGFFHLGRDGRTTDRVRWVRGGATAEVGTFTFTRGGSNAQSCRYLALDLTGGAPREPWGEELPDDVMPHEEPVEAEATSAALVPAGAAHRMHLLTVPRARGELDGAPGVVRHGDVAAYPVLTPALARLLTAHEPALVAEAGDGWLVVSAFGATDATDAALWERFAAIADAVPAQA